MNWKESLLFFMVWVVSLTLSAFGYKSVEAQPMLNPHELVLEYHLPKDCLKSKEKFFNCSNTKASLSLMSGNLGSVQTTLLAKLSGDKGKVGGQMWMKINNYFWIGTELVSNLSLDADYEVFGALELNYGGYSFFPYGAFHLKSEHFASGGLSMYLTEDKSLKLGAEYKHGDNPEVVVLIGASIPKKAFNELKVNFGKFLGIGEEKKEESPEPPEEDQKVYL